VKPKVIPQPEPLKREVKSNPVPKNLFKKTLADLEKEKDDRRKLKTDAVRAEYVLNEKKKFKLTTEDRPNKFDKIKAEIISKQEEELQFNRKHAREMPDFESKKAPIKLNQAAVLREGHLLKI
jgi:hypothetical protein